MRPSTSRTLLLLHFSSPSSALFSTTAAASSSPQFAASKNRTAEESKAVKVTVWWDFENCGIPNGISPYRVAHRITAALRSQGIKGPVTITGFGNVLQLSHAMQNALCTTGVCLNHVPNRGKNSTDKSIFANLVYWVAQNPPPAHFFLISGDRDFASILHRLRMSNYNILIASDENISSALSSAATLAWKWNELVKGGELSCKHFNYPPDGLHGSWYGYSKISLDHLSVDEDETIHLPSKDSIKEVPEPKHKPIPKALINKINQILVSRPKGITICELHDELRRVGSNVDKDYYGYKKLSSLISSLTNIATVKPHPAGESDLIAYSVHCKLRESVQACPRPSDALVDCCEKNQTIVGEASDRYLQVSRDIREETSSDNDVLTSHIDKGSKVTKKNIKPEKSLLSNDSPQDNPTGDSVEPLKDDSLGETNVNVIISRKTDFSKANKGSIDTETSLSMNDPIGKDATTCQKERGKAPTKNSVASLKDDKTDGIEDNSFGPNENKVGIIQRILRSITSLFQPQRKKDKLEESGLLTVDDDRKTRETEKDITKGENGHLVEGHSNDLLSTSKAIGNQNKHNILCEDASSSKLIFRNQFLEFIRILFAISKGIRACC